MFRELLGPASKLELPAALVAIRAKVPDWPGATVKDSVAEVPPELIVAELIVTAGGADAGAKVNVAPVR